MIIFLNILLTQINKNYVQFLQNSRGISSHPYYLIWKVDSEIYMENQRATLEASSRDWPLLVYCCCCYCCWVASVVSDSVRPHRRQPTRLPCPWDSPGKNTGVGCHFLLQCMKVKVKSCPTVSNPMDCSPLGIFQARVLEWVAIAFSAFSVKKCLLSVYLKFGSNKRQVRIKNQTSGKHC